jgi:hypothetical protein
MIRSVNKITARFSRVQGTIFTGLTRAACLFLLFLPGYAHAVAFRPIFHPHGPISGKDFLGGVLFIAAFLLVCFALSLVLTGILYALRFAGRVVWTTLFRNR